MSRAPCRMIAWFLSGLLPRGTQIVTDTPRIDPAHARPRPWLPRVAAGEAQAIAGSDLGLLALCQALAILVGAVGRAGVAQFPRSVVGAQEVGVQLRHVARRQHHVAGAGASDGDAVDVGVARRLDD